MSSSTQTKPLAGTIMGHVNAGRLPVLRAVGAGAVNQAVKAIGIAQGDAAMRGLTLSCRIGFDTAENLRTVRDNGSKEITVILFRIDVR